MLRSLGYFSLLCVFIQRLLFFKPIAVVKHSIQVISKYMTTSAFNSNQTRSTVLSTHLTTSSISESSAMYQIHTTSTVKDTTMSSSVIKDIPTIEAREKTNTPKPTTDDPETGTYIFDDENEHNRRETISANFITDNNSQ